MVTTQKYKQKTPQIFETFKTVQHFTKSVPPLCHTFTCTRRIKKRNKERHFEAEGRQKEIALMLHSPPVGGSRL